jgi:hypothetical protein
MLFANWMNELNKIAGKAGHSSHQDWDSWRDDFEAGLSPQTAWDNEWREEEP